LLPADVASIRSPEPPCAKADRKRIEQRANDPSLKWKEEMFMHNQLRSSTGFALSGAFAPLAAIGIACLAMATSAWSQTYYIDEATNFSGARNTCGFIGGDLNTVTSTLRSALSSNGWSGQRWTNPDAWPQDFYESTIAGLGGLDNIYGDNAQLTVYAGHGIKKSVGKPLLAFGAPHNGQCYLDLSPVGEGGQALLGEGGGGKAAYAMWVTSCTLNLSYLSKLFDHDIRQHFGYHNSPSVKDDQPRDFFNATNNKSNTRAWLDEMEDRPGWFTGDNSPIVLTWGADSADCDSVSDTAKLRGRSLLSSAPAHNWFCWIMIDHGDGGC
jgi:hypothetical protein